MRTFRWWEIVGCDTSNRSATAPHDSSPAAAISCTIRNRVGSASAFSARISCGSLMSPTRA